MSWFQNSTPSDSLTILTSVLLSVRAIFMLFTTNAPKNEHQRGFRYVHFLRINRIIDKEIQRAAKPQINNGCNFQNKFPTFRWSLPSTHDIAEVILEFIVF